MALTKTERRKRIKLRIRKNINGTNEMPRLSVFRSNKDIYVQLIDDSQGKTLLAVSSQMKEIAERKV
jgi:large subunit ribosomal protein L18